MAEKYASVQALLDHKLAIPDAALLKPLYASTVPETCNRETLLDPFRTSRQHYLHELCEELASLGTAREHVAARIKTVESELSVIHLATLSPIRKIPLDVLCDILGRCIERPTIWTVDPDTTSASRNLRSLILMSHICRSWRQAIYGTPLLWREVIMTWRPGMHDELDRSCIVDWLARAGSLPFAYTIFADPLYGKLPRYRWLEDTLRGPIISTGGHNKSPYVHYVTELMSDPVRFPADRLQNLRLVLAYPHLGALAALPPRSLPRLSSLHISILETSRPQDDFSFPRIDVFADAVDLRRLCLKVVGNAPRLGQCLRLQWAQLTHLSVELSVCCTRSTYIDVIRLCTALAVLRVAEGKKLGVASDLSSHPDAIVLLPHLRALRLPSGSRCLDALSPANIAALQVDTTTASILTLCLQRMPCITSLSVSRTTFLDDDGVRPLLDSLPLLQSLSLDQCSLSLASLFDNLKVGYGRAEYVPRLLEVRVTNCRKGWRPLLEEDVDNFVGMIGMRWHSKDVCRLRHAEMWPLPSDFVTDCRKYLNGLEAKHFVLVLEQERATSVNFDAWGEEWEESS
ncbi:hypothetical protein EV122DRAFT_275530 [Schizophyllum commune]